MIRYFMVGFFLLSRAILAAVVHDPHDIRGQVDAFLGTVPFEEAFHVNDWAIKDVYSVENGKAGEKFGMEWRVLRTSPQYMQYDTFIGELGMDIEEYNSVKGSQFSWQVRGWGDAENIHIDSVGPSSFTYAGKKLPALRVTTRLIFKDGTVEFIHYTIIRAPFFAQIAVLHHQWKEAVNSKDGDYYWLRKYGSE